MKRMRMQKKHLLSFLLVLCMVLSMHPLASLAADTNVVYTLADSVEAGKEYLIVNSNEAGSAFALTNKSDANATPVTIDTGGNTITTSEDMSASLWSSFEVNSGYGFTNGSSYLKLSGGTLAFSSSTYNSGSFVYTAENFLIYSSNYRLRYSGTNEAFVSGNVSSSSSDATSHIYLYAITVNGGGAEAIYLGFTSDVHGSASNLEAWLTNVPVTLSRMSYCGDYSYQMTSAPYYADYDAVVSLTNSYVGNERGVYTSGNHEYYVNGETSTIPSYFTDHGLLRIGEAVKTDNYIIYCMGTSGWASSGNYPDSDIETLRAYLSEAPTDIPIFIIAHFPLHNISSRTTGNADKMIALLNEHTNAVFLWGHNHSQSGETHYGEILTAGNSIQYRSGHSTEINFTYACAGAMYSNQQSPYYGLVAKIISDSSTHTLEFKYYDLNGSPAGTPVTVVINRLGGGNQTHVITASAGENGSINPAGEKTVLEGASQSYAITPAAGYEVDTVLVDNEPVELINGVFSFSNITGDHTISASFKKLTGTKYILADSVVSGGQYILVSNSYALTNNNGLIAATPVNVASDNSYIFVPTGTDADSLLWIVAESTGNLADDPEYEANEDYTINNDGYYFSRVSGSGSVPSEITSTPKNSTYSHYPYYEWSYDVSNATLKQRGSGTDYYAYYSSSNGAFCTSNTVKNLRLYVAEDTVDSYTVSGTITSNVGSGDVVNVRLMNGGTEVDSRTVIGSSALYSFDAVAAGSYTLEVSAANHVSRTYEITVVNCAITQDAKINLIGDVTGDGCVNVSDYTKVLRHVKGTMLLTDAYTLACADVNGDDIIDESDCDGILEHCTGIALLW